MPVGGTSASSVGSKDPLTLIAAAVRWICCSSLMSRGTAEAGSCIIPPKVRFPGGLSHEPELGQSQMGRKKDSGSEINMSSGLPNSHQVPPAQDPRQVHHHPGPAASISIPRLLHCHLQARLPACGGKSPIGAEGRELAPPSRGNSDG